MRSIAVVSGKGGVGKTTSAINLAHALAKKKKILLVDANFTTPNVHIYLGWPIIKKSLIQYMNDEHSLKDAIFTHETGLRVLPSVSSTSEIKRLKYSKVKYLTQELEDEAEIVIFDSAAGLGKETVTAMQACDEVLIVTNPELGAVLDAQKTVQLAQEMGKTILGVALNKVRKDRFELKVSEVERLLDLPVIAIIPYDDKVRKALKKHRPITLVHPKSSAAKEFWTLAAVINGEQEIERGLRARIKRFIYKRLGYL